MALFFLKMDFRGLKYHSENVFGAFLFEICFLALIAAKMIFCSCRFENDFLLLLLWKLFLAPVALKNVCRLPLWKLFFVLFPLNLILGASRFENFLVFLWKCLFGGHRFENSFLALVVFWKFLALVVVKMFLVLEVLKMILCRF